MKINATKTTVIHIGKKNPRMTYSINGIEIKSVEQQNDLGVLSFSAHISSVSSSCFKLIGIMIKKVFGTLNKKQFTSIFKTLIRPKLDYCSSIWSPGLQKDIDLIEKVQRRATKLVRGMQGKSYEDRLQLLSHT